jgi:hypothetical protein
MTPKISQYLNKTILVSIPALFDDGHCRAFTLLGVELHGLWLQSDELTKRLLHNDMQMYASAGPVVFVPFAQIAGVLVATQVPVMRSAPAASKPKTESGAAYAKPTSTAASKAKTPPGRKPRGA